MSLDFVYSKNVDIIITSYQGKEVLTALLNSLQYQDCLGFGIIIVYDGSTCDQKIIPSSFPSLSISQYDTQRKSEYCLGLARCIGIYKSNAKYIILLDQDAVCSPRFVSSHITYATPGCIVAGPRFPPNDHPFKQAQLQKAQQLLDLGNKPHKISKLLYDDCKLIENNISFYRSDVQRLGSFSIVFRSYGFVGQEFFRRLALSNFFFRVSPSAAILHVSDPSEDTLALKQSHARRMNYILPFFANNVSSFAYKNLIRVLSPLSHEQMLRLTMFGIALLISPAIIFVGLFKIIYKKLWQN